ncbi:MAG: HD domain-containing protein [Xanthomonadaceae bacterium]|nr:HD domain-containing protein [Xanthomonadaceae bacterium]MDE2278294.1 HD domain-containing protein [Xanthomonadaceae bacterium]
MKAGAKPYLVARSHDGVPSDVPAARWPSRWPDTAAAEAMAVDAAAEAGLSSLELLLGSELGRLDAHTSAHCARVARLALALATDLGLAGEQREILYLAARVHDVGKVGIPDAILHKSQALSGVEWEVMKSHSLRGEHIVRTGLRVPFGEQIALVVRHHHEHYDGDGYPDGLRGHAIPLASRILAVVDNYDAIRVARDYHPPRSHRSTLAILASERGTKHDPLILDALLSHDRHWFEQQAALD